MSELLGKPKATLSAWYNSTAFAVTVLKLVMLHKPRLIFSCSSLLPVIPAPDCNMLSDRFLVSSLCMRYSVYYTQYIRLHKAQLHCPLHYTAKRQEQLPDAGHDCLYAVCCLSVDNSKQWTPSDLAA